MYSVLTTGTNESVVDSRLLEKTHQTLEYRLNIQGYVEYTN